MYKITAVCVSSAKGVCKKPADSARFIEEWGIENDAHAGKWHRQISLLSAEAVRDYIELGKENGKDMSDIVDGVFGENLLVTIPDLEELPVGTRLKIKPSNAVLEVTQIGKQCHDHCEIFKRVGVCIMPHKGIFARVLSGGEVHPGDEIEVMQEREPS